MKTTRKLKKKLVTSAVGAVAAAVAAPMLVLFAAGTAEAAPFIPDFPDIPDFPLPDPDLFLPPPPPPPKNPDVWFDPSLGVLNVHVKNWTSQDTSCVYTADWYDRNFRLPADGIATITIVPAVPRFKDWDVNVTCDNGTATHMTYFY